MTLASGPLHDARRQLSDAADILGLSSARPLSVSLLVLDPSNRDVQPRAQCTDRRAEGLDDDDAASGDRERAHI